jgi:hypothetical protein
MTSLIIWYPLENAIGNYTWNAQLAQLCLKLYKEFHAMKAYDSRFIPEPTIPILTVILSRDLMLHVQ